MPIIFPINWFLLSLSAIFLIHIRQKKMHIFKRKEHKDFFNKTFSKQWQW